MFIVYVIESEKTERRYTGYTEDIQKRLKEHNSGKVRSTKAYVPYKLVYKEEFGNKTDARKRELFLKTGQERRFVKESLRIQ